MDLRDLTRVAPAGHTTTWLAGTIRFKYIQVKAPLNDWDHIQAHRKVLAVCFAFSYVFSRTKSQVIGIAHCPVSMNLKETYSAFVSASLQVKIFHLDDEFYITFVSLLKTVQLRVATNMFCF